RPQRRSGKGGNGNASHEASHVLYFMCCDFPDFGHKAKYAPFGMLGKPKSAVIIKGAHFRLWVNLYLVGGSLTSWAGNPFEPQFPVFLAQRRLEARLPNSTRSSSSKQRNGVVGLAHSLPTSSATHRFMISVAS